MPQPLPEGVTVGGVLVGGLLATDAATQIRAYYSSPLKLRLGRHVYTADPNTLATPQIAKALERARTAQPFANVGLAVVVKPARVQEVRRNARQASRATAGRRAPAPAELQAVPDARASRHRARAARDGEGDREGASSATRATRSVLRTSKTPAQVTRANFGPVIVIHRGSNRLYLYKGARLNRLFPVATGQSVYPTPLGSFHIVVMWRNPWWYPPNSPWAAGEQPVPPGPNNPLGTRWMGISAPGVGIHGTNNDASIGYSVSHGCIRMHVSDAEWLFNHVDIGTPVFIVSA